MRDATKTVHHPKVQESEYNALTVPIHRASTIVFENAEAYAMRGRRDLDSYSYGMQGTPTQRVLEAQIAALEKGRHTEIMPSGQAAIAAIFLTGLKPGDHLLLAETAYPPVRNLCHEFLAPLGITWSTYPPGIGAGIRDLLTSNTALIWMESPGSTTMEVEDVPALCSVAKEAGILTGIDNTWATPLLFKPICRGVDFSMQALTKYAGGHSDLLMGSVTVNDTELRKRLRGVTRVLGFHTSPDAISLALRGIETMALRLAHCGQVALTLAQEIQSNYRMDVLHPALPSAAGHELWKRDFAGASGVFSVVLPELNEAALQAALSNLQVFAIGASWGGTRSLVAPMTVTSIRATPHPRNKRTILRLSIGLEDVNDLRQDLYPVLERIAAVALPVLPQREKPEAGGMAP